MSETLVPSSRGAPMDRTGSKPLPLDTFALDQAILEVRYEPAYLFWDRIGQIWHEIAKTEDKLRSLEAQPNRTSFAIADSFQLHANLDNSRLQAFFPARNLNDFSQKCDVFFRTVFAHLEVQALDRIGLRLLYSREYPKIEDAANAIRDLRLLVLPPERQFGIVASSARPEYGVRCEDVELGFSLRIRSDTQTIEINPPPGIKDIEPQRPVHHRLVFDIDHYTTVPVRHGQFKPSEWIKTRLHATNRDSRSFLGS